MLAFVQNAALLAFVVPLGIVVAYVGTQVARFAWYMPWSSWKAWGMLPAALAARFRWRKLTRALGLTMTDKETQIVSRRSFSPLASFLRLRVEKPTKPKVRYLRCLITPDGYGIVARIRTLPGVDRTAVTKQAEHLRNAWGCVRVQISQPAPGRLIIRGLRRDPLTTPLPADEAPYDLATATRVYLGRDEWAVDRWLDLRGITGICIGGLPRFGKSALTNGLLYQLEPWPEVQVAVIDGKGGALFGDYGEHEERLWRLVGDDLDDCENVLDEWLDEMHRRQTTIRAGLGVKNGWDHGPTPEWPYLLLIWDECHTHFDLDGVKGNKEKEAQVRRIRSKAADAVKKSGSVMMCILFITQKQTGDAIPTAIRDNCTVGLSFATKTRDASVAALGELIREWPGLCPSTLRRRPDYIGVSTAYLPDSDVEEPFVRLRHPYLTDDRSAQRAQETAALCKAPSELRQPRIVEPVA